MEIKTTTKEKNKKVNHKYNRDKDRELVTGKFIFHEVPGGAMSFVYRAHKEDPVERYDFIDGQIYKIPLGVAKHLNKNLWYPEYEYVKGEQFSGGYNHMNGTGMRVGKKVRRCSFQSLEFVDVDDLTPTGSPVLTVESIGI